MTDLEKAIVALQQEGAMVNVSKAVAEKVMKTLKSQLKAQEAARKYQAQINIWTRYAKAQIGKATDEEIEAEIAKMDAKKAAGQSEKEEDPETANTQE